jgi:hypothetical protein
VTVLCKICRAETDPHACGLVLQKYDVGFFRCRNCGFIQTEEPFWLAESYASAINRTDVGYVGRNVAYSKMVKAVICAMFNPQASFVDFGGGYGMLVRLMRDSGFDFRWQDKHCDNLFAQGFEVLEDSNTGFELLTAFEVFEHLVDPLGGVEEMLGFADSIMFSTELVPDPVPALDEWFYYGLDHGQHVAFYTRGALKEIGRRFNLNVVSYGSYMHLFSRNGLSEWRWRVALNRFSKLAIDLLYRRDSLLWPDYDRAMIALRHERRQNQQ